MPKVVLQYDSQICFAMSYHGTLKLLAKYKKMRSLFKKTAHSFCKESRERTYPEAPFLISLSSVKELFR